VLNGGALKMSDKVKQLSTGDSFNDEMIRDAVDYLELHGIMQQVRYSAVQEAAHTVRELCNCSDGEFLILQDEARRLGGIK